MLQIWIRDKAKLRQILTSEGTVSYVVAAVSEESEKNTLLEGGKSLSLFFKKILNLGYVPPLEKDDGLVFSVLDWSPLTNG